MEKVEKRRSIRNTALLLFLAADLVAMGIVLAVLAPTRVKAPPAPVLVVEVPDTMPKGAVFVPEEYRAILAYWCDREGVPYPIMARIALWESGWDPYADNGKDQGLMQLNKRYHDWFAWKFNENQGFDPFNSSFSIKIACRYLRWLYKQTGDYRQAVMAYNCGLTRFQTEGPPKSTVRYMHLVFGD